MPHNIETLNAPSDRTFLNENWAYILTKDKFDRAILGGGRFIYGGLIFGRKINFNLKSVKLINFLSFFQIL